MGGKVSSSRLSRRYSRPLPTASQSNMNINIANITANGEHIEPQESPRPKRDLKLLLLGISQSGKSTIAKQLKILYQGPFQNEDLLSFRPTIHTNIVLAIQTLIRSAQEFELESPSQYTISTDLQQEANELLQLGIVREIPSHIITSIKKLWSDSAIQATFKNPNVPILDCTKYILDDIERLTRVGAVPTQEDLLRLRIRSTGITETEFILKERTFRVVDVGGTRSERKKWVHTYEAVSVIIFVVAVSEYNLTLLEDSYTNRLTETENLYSEICNSEQFQNVPIVVFFNKMDLFNEKIKKVPLSEYYPEYAGGADPSFSIEYMKSRFRDLDHRKFPRVICMHAGCAIDTEEIRTVFNATVDYTKL